MGHKMGATGSTTASLTMENTEHLLSRQNFYTLFTLSLWRIRGKEKCKA